MSAPPIDDVADAAAEQLFVPARSIVLCAVPESGEHEVAAMLERRGAGRMGTWFDVEQVAPPLLSQWGVEHLDEYIAALHRHCATSGGVFGLVLHWAELRRLHRQVAGLRQPTAERMLDIVRTIAPEPTFVWLRRTDRAGHVLALRAAHRRRDTAAIDDEPSEQDRGRLDTLIDAAEAVWVQWFAAAGVTPIEARYEGLVSEPRALAELADALALPAPEPA